MTRYWLLRLLSAAGVVIIVTHPAVNLDLVGSNWMTRLAQCNGPDAWVAMGLLFLVVLFGVTRWFVLRAPVDNPQSGIRRLMLSSMLRLVGGAGFLFVHMFVNFRANPHQKAHVIPVLIYGLFFVSLLVFEIFEKRANLRPDSEA